jgi:DNA polymerase-3 subunit gamma/tau
MANSESDSSAAQKPSSGEYVVVARRYRPQSFTQLVGQHQVAHALANAIRTQRVGHAYLFTGARGVGKTSTARIFAKALNCQQGPTESPCNACDICESITAGGDVDVLEIDGASNRGIDEIRQLRSNVNIRPGRARFKIYIIDEVHMLTTQAFNALLKTLEEPPDHVKFMFCTTDPEKIPLTVLSRCQRFDFAPVRSESIVERLEFIVESEGGEADPEALQILARRAAGSMRDSQSLLEQLLSFSSGRITAVDVHAMLGTAESGRLADMTQQLADRDAAGALRELDRAVNDGVDVGQFAEQLVGYFRDLMAAAVGCDAELLLQAAPSSFEQLEEVAKQFGLESLMAALQILDQCVTRMRQSTQSRMLLEIAVVRICNLELLDELPQVIAQLRSLGAAAGAGSAGAGQAQRPPKPRSASARTPTPTGGSKSSSTEKKTESPHVTTSETHPISPDSVESVWRQVLSDIEDLTAEYGAVYSGVATPAPNRLVVSFTSRYTLQKEGCERPERKAKIEQVLSRIAGRPMRVDFELLDDGAVAEEKAPRHIPLRQRMRETEQQPFVKKAIELFDGEVTRLEEPRPKEGQ